MDRPPPIDARRSNGTRVAMILLGILGAGVLTCGVGVYAFFQSEAGQTVLSTGRELASAYEESQNAPGAAELRALGCEELLILELQRLLPMIELFADEEQRRQMESFDTSMTMVFCQAAASDSPPSCDALASVYGEVAQPSSGFFVGVQVTGKLGDHCRAEYDASGALLRNLL